MQKNRSRPTLNRSLRALPHLSYNIREQSDERQRRLPLCFPVLAQGGSHETSIAFLPSGREIAGMCSANLPGSMMAMEAPRPIASNRTPSWSARDQHLLHSGSRVISPCVGLFYPRVGVRMRLIRCVYTQRSIYVLGKIGLSDIVP